MEKTVTALKANELPIFAESGITLVLFLLLLILL
jgi:hypothetical protein